MYRRQLLWVLSAILVVIGASQGYDTSSFALDDQIIDQLLADLKNGKLYSGGESLRSLPEAHVEPRRPEQESNVFQSGHQYVSGGAGEGHQSLQPDGFLSNKQEVKTDADLPSYCSPPNPCPKGYTAADGCQENIPDTAEFNRYYILKQIHDGRCSCDYEHMTEESCPRAGDSTIIAWDDIEKYSEDLFHDEQLTSKIKNPYISVGEKRMSMTAKKGAHNLSKRSALSSPNNPYLAGERLPVVAKKSPPMDRSVL